MRLPRIPIPPISYRASLLGLITSRSGVLALVTVGNMAIRIVSSVVLTRLLAPDAFGLVGLIASLFVVITMVTDLGFQSYIVRHHEGDDPRFLDVIWTVHIVRGAGLALLAAISAPLVAHLMGKPALEWPLVVSSLNLLLAGMTSLAFISALRSDGVRRLSLIEFGLALFQVLVSIVLAYALRSVWAIIIAMILQNVARVAVSYVAYPNAVRRLARDREISQPFFQFSRVVMASSAITLLISQADKLVLGRLLTLPEFGLYAIAINIAMTFAGFAENYVSRVVYPIYVRLWREERETLAGAYYGSRRRTSLLFSFACGGMLGSASLAVAILYDPRYAEAAVYLAWLMVAATLRLPVFAASETMMATGDVKATLRGNLVRLGWLALAGIPGYLLFGTIGLIAAVGLVEVPTLGYFWLLLHRIRLLNLREEMVYIVIAAAGAAVGFVGSSTILWLWPSI